MNRKQIEENVSIRYHWGVEFYSIEIDGFKFDTHTDRKCYVSTENTEVRFLGGAMTLDNFVDSVFYFLTDDLRRALHVGLWKIKD